MDWDRRSLRVGAIVIACAIFLRLGNDGFFRSVVEALSGQEAMSVMLFLETGRIVRPAQPQSPTEPPEETQALPPEETQALPPETTTAPEAEDGAVAVFGASDAALVEINSVCGYDADVSALLQQTLSWDLTQDAPTVLIVHSHGTESYTKSDDYVESSKYRTLNPDYNVVSVGTRLTQILEAGGIKVLHDTTMHDHPSYSSSYNNSRKSIQAYLKQYPSIALVLDLHRDSVENSSGKQIRYTADVGKEKAAQLMMVVGTDASGLTHPHWPENMALAVKLHAQLEKNYPGICRPISFRKQRFNQDLSPGAMLIEVGSAGNYRAEALLAAELLGKTILELAAGTAA